MDKLGTLAGVSGILVSAAAVAGRFIGTPVVFRQEASTVLMLGIALMVLGCFLKTLKK